MENLIPIIVMIVIFTVISGIANRVKGAVEEAQRRAKEAERPVRRDDLPEATRRQIYGSDAPTVRRARPVVIERPPEYDGEGVDDEEMEAPPAPVPPMRPRPVQTAEPRGAETPWGEFRRRVEEGARNLEAEARRQQEELRRRRREAELTRRREAEEAQRREAAGRRAPTPTARRERPVETARAEAARGPVPSAGHTLRPQSAKRSGRRRHPLLGDSSDVRRAIVLREVLGPPRAFD